MTTYAQLDKYAKLDFIHNMEARGFKHYKTFLFAKENSKGVHYLLTSQILSSKENLRIRPFIWVPEFDEDKAFFEYPKDASIYAKFPTWDYSDWRDLWTITTEADSHEFFSSFLLILDKDVIPWFESVKVGQDLINVLNHDAKTDPRIRAVIPKIIENYR